MTGRTLALSLILCSAAVLPAWAQSTFELSTPGLTRSLRASLTERDLRITDHQGRDTLYLREPRVDSPDGLFIAYRNSTTGQVVRWPVSNRGPMQIGTAGATGLTFRTSRMQVIPAGGLGAAIPADRPVLPPGAIPADAVGTGQGQVANDLFAQVWQQRQPQPQVLRLSIRDDRGREWYLGQSPGNRLTMLATPEPNSSDWFVVPAGRGFVRVQQQVGFDWLALAVRPNRSLVIERVAQDASQLWRVVQTNFGSPGYWLESAAVSGYALNGLSNGQVTLAPIGGGFGQVWLPQPAVLAVGYEPLWRTVNQEIRPNAPLQPAEINVINSHRQALRILIADRRTSTTRQIRVEPSSAVPVAFDRDSGSTLVETYEVRSRGGVWERQQFVTEIPASPLYDLSVYEEFLQSIAIDRTGTSPNPIEDINYQPKSVGWIPLPAGRALPDRGQIDAYAEALTANNPGAVRRFDPRSLEKPSSQPDPLESLLESAQPAAPRPATDRQNF